MEEIPVVLPCFKISGENPVSEGLKNVTKLGSLDVVVEILAQHVVDVDGVTSDQIVHAGKPRSSELTCWSMPFQYLSEKIMGTPQVEE